MPSVSKTCTITGEEFAISERDQEFYERIGVPPPTICHIERLRRKLIMRNARNLYKRKCDKSGKLMVSMYSDKVPFPVYHRDEWWKEDWNPPSQEFDFDRPFFEQMKELRDKTPRSNVFTKRAENSDFCNISQGIKDCYLTFVSFDSRNLVHCHRIIECNDLLDCYYCTKVQRSYDCIYCFNSFNLRYCSDCLNCSDGTFLYDCIGCKNCFMCTNLRKKEFCILNKQHSEQEYKEKMKDINFGSHSMMEMLKKKFNDFKTQNAVHRANKIERSEDSTGNRILEGKDLEYCFEVEKARDCVRCTECTDIKDCFDSVSFGNESELSYEVQECCYFYNFRFCNFCYGKSNLTYSDECHNCRDCFGCVGLKNGQYSILNKQYPEEEYKALVSRIIAHMQKTGEWGEFFPKEYSPFDYNETEASDYLPLTRDEALLKGFTWCEEMPSEEGEAVDFLSVPDDIKDAKQEIIKKTFFCDLTQKKFKITPQEFVFYKEQNIPLPRRSPDQRHHDRFKNRLPVFLWPRTCMKCGKDIQTPYTSDRPEKVYCRECYLAALY